MGKLKTAVLISGRGSNLRSLIKNCKRKNFPAKISLVISDNPHAPGLSYAFEEKIQTKIIGKKSFDRELHQTLLEHKIKFICLAGFMRLLSPYFINKWSGKIINIHPSLLPSFKGLNAQKRAIQKGVKIAGCTVHFVNSEMDAGPIIIQAAVPVLNNDDESKLSKRILTQEHKIYPEALRLVANKKIRMIKDKILFAKEKNSKT